MADHAPVRKNRYCGSKFNHAAHEKPMVGAGREHIVFACQGKGNRPPWNGGE